MLISTSPVPLGVIAILPFASVDETVLPSTLILSTLKSVTAEFVPIVVPSIAPPSISTLLISTSPVPLGVIAMFPLAPSVIVITPVVEFPVLRVTSKSPLDLNTPAADPVPADTSPLIATVPSVEFVIVSSFSKVMPAEAVISNAPANTVAPLS